MRNRYFYNFSLNNTELFNLLKLYYFIHQGSLFQSFSLTQFKSYKVKLKFSNNYSKTIRFRNVHLSNISLAKVYKWKYLHYIIILQWFKISPRWNASIYCINNQRIIQTMGILKTQFRPSKLIIYWKIHVVLCIHSENSRNTLMCVKRISILYLSK